MGVLSKCSVFTDKQTLTVDIHTQAGTDGLTDGPMLLNVLSPCYVTDNHEKVKDVLECRVMPLSKVLLLVFSFAHKICDFSENYDDDILVKI